MKKSIFALLLFININIYAQQYKDILYTSNGDSIKCKITLVNDNNIFYDHKVKNEIENDNISLEKLTAYVHGGVRTNLKNLPKVIIFDSTDKTAGDNLIEASKIIYTSIIIVLSGSAIIAVSIVTSPVIAIIGGVVALSGSIYSIRAWGKIKQAGNILNKHKI